MARQAVMLNRVEEELPSAYDIAKADNKELQEIMEKVTKSTEVVIAQLKTASQLEEALPKHKLLGLDKELRSIKGLLKVETAKKVHLEECIRREKCKLSKIGDNPEYNDGIREDIRNDDLKVRQESTDLLKDRLTSQIMRIKETIAKSCTKTPH